MTLNKPSSPAEPFLQKTRIALILCIYAVFVYVAMQSSLFLRDYLHVNYVYTESWEASIRKECAAFKGCKSVSIERNSFFPEAGSNFAQIFRPQAVLTISFDRSVLNRAATFEFAGYLHKQNPNLFIKIN